MIYLMANNSGVWKLRQNGNQMGWMIGFDCWKRPVRAGHWPMPYALDNGMFFTFGTQPHGNDRLCEFFGRCGKALQYHSPLFAVVPDMPYDAEETMRRYQFWNKQCRKLAPHWRWGIAVQDGMTICDIERLGVGINGQHDAVCVGGSSEWKDATIRMWATWARERGVWCHVLRVNDTKRLQVCQDEEVSSVDGTGLFPGRPESTAESHVGIASESPVAIVIDDNGMSVPVYAKKEDK